METKNNKVIIEGFISEIRHILLFSVLLCPVLLGLDPINTLWVKMNDVVKNELNLTPRGEIENGETVIKSFDILSKTDFQSSKLSSSFYLRKHSCANHDCKLQLVFTPRNLPDGKHEETLVIENKHEKRFIKISFEIGKI